MSVKIENEVVRICNVGIAHTSTDCIVYLENRKILIAGDIIWNKIHPMVLDPHCSISSWIKILDKLDKEFEIKTIIPGHGEISDKSVLTEMQKYFQSIKNAVNNPEALQSIKRKYDSLKSVPFTTGFCKTVKKIKKEYNVKDFM